MAPPSPDFHGRDHEATPIAANQFWVSAFFRLARCLKAGEPAWRPWGRGWPELVRGDSSVVFTANRAALCSGSP